MLDSCKFEGFIPKFSRYLPLSGGEPPVCSKIKAEGPPSRKADAHRPMVWGSRSKASATAEPVQPWASNRRAYHLSRSRGVGDRIIRRRKSLASICHTHRQPLSHSKTD